MAQIIVDLIFVLELFVLMEFVLFYGKIVGILFLAAQPGRWMEAGFAAK